MSIVSDGDLVRQVRDVDRQGMGLTGIYRYIKGQGPAIIYDSRTDFGHDLRGECEYGFGWFLNYVSDVEPRIIPYDPTQGNEEDDI